VTPLTLTICITFILFWVIVPVLSEHTYLAAPIVSQQVSLRTKILSLCIALIVYAKVIVTAKGKPSGIVTTTTVTAIIM